MDFSSFNIVDAVLAAILFIGVWGGWRAGFVRTALEVACLAASLLAAFTLYRLPAELLDLHAPFVGMWGRPLSFLATLVLVSLLLSMVAGRVSLALAPATHEHKANRVLGVIPGAAKGAVNATIAAAVLLALPVFDRLSAKAHESALAGRLAVPAEWLESKVSAVFGDAVHRTLTRLTVEPQSTRTVRLPFTASQPAVRPELEAQMLEMVNEERRAANLHPLKADPELTEVARAHSKDMLARGYFSHVTPEGSDPFDRMRKGGVRYLTAGENLALAPNLHIAHQGLMNSPGHRANILKASFGRVGIGVLDSGVRGLMVTQNFRN